ncbi:protein kinase 4 isoform X2 [Drosophila busckii]|uniref:protein kinase 4 isoform X2 n=1 Tax=Drosophila busckii TaxID=30019 RepID=UPI001433158A|nr:protein kinase 4 isoform X2 [Drosophila busckii]
MLMRSYLGLALYQANDQRRTTKRRKQQRTCWGIVTSTSSGNSNNSVTSHTRSSSDLDGENYCSISAEDVKTEIIEHETELSMLDRQTSTPLSLSYYKPTDLTYNNRKRKAPLDENDVSDMANGVGVGIVGGVVGALTLTPIKSTTQLQVQTQSTSLQQQQQQQLNHTQIAFHALQQHFNHNLSHSSHNGNGQPHQQQQQQLHHQQQQQQQQQQHSNNMAQKRDRDRDLSSSPTGPTNLNTNNNNNNSSSNGNNHLSSTSLELHALSSSSSGNSSMSLKPNNNLSANHVDEYGVFGEYVAITIRKLKTAKSKIVVKHLINNLLYEAELGKYDQGMPASKEPPQLYKMQ